MIKFEDKLHITEQDLEYFKTEWLNRVDSVEEKERYRFHLDNDIIKVLFLTTHHHEDGTKSTSSTGLNFVKIKHSWADYISYHCYDSRRNLVFDSELFFMDNCKITQHNLKGGK
ncbi:hypothetical protein SDC9_15164 [bioreactor metagenome]|uniref:Uncharacterized protein n=1 Tax=bioreactor metagenome TaxID=1076179 RepID=A0A644TT47_9ZZZZ|nr:hypothetical protein [Desulfitobacterium hafniense]MEA5023916.1 hypothetical protein [Desulfitobacterium hafniense]